jgi:hypothetical protein
MAAPQIAANNCFGFILYPRFPYAFSHQQRVRDFTAQEGDCTGKPRSACCF